MRRLCLISCFFTPIVFFLYNNFLSKTTIGSFWLGFNFRFAYLTKKRQLGWRWSTEKVATLDVAWNSRDPLLRVAFEQLVKLSLSHHSTATLCITIFSKFFSSTVWVWGFWNIFAKDKEASSLAEEEKIPKKGRCLWCHQSYQQIKSN